MKPRLLIFFIALLSASLIVAPSAEAGRKIDPKITQLGLKLIENMDLTSMNSVIYGKADRTSQNSLDWKRCGEITSKICTNSEEIMIIHYLPLCATNLDINCLAGTWSIGSDGARVDGRAVKRLPAKGNGDFKAQPEMDLPAGVGAGEVFQYNGVKHSGNEDKYLVVLRNQMTIRKEAGEPATKYPYSINSFKAGIIPVVEINGDFRPKMVTEGYGSDSGGVSPEGGDCVATDTGICLLQRDFPTETQFGMKIRVSRKLTGWFHGRIHKPTIETTDLTRGQEVTIQALPVRVSALDYDQPVTQYSQAAKDAVFADREWGVSGSDSTVRLVAGLDENEARRLFTLFNPVFKDTSSYDHTYWNVNTLDYTQDGTIERCTNKSGKVAGIVTTNSLLYSSGPPSYNKENASLDYQLASPHFESNGKEATGTYDLLIRSDVARCIYGFSTAPVKASISILSSEGAAKVATTVLGEKGGWLFVSANGFGFSSPTVRITLRQEKTIKIVCTKAGKKISVSGTKPTCPKGYKK